MRFSSFLFFLFYAHFGFCQKQSQFVLSIETTWKKGQKILAKSVQKDTFDIYKNKKISKLSIQDTLFHQVKNEKINELRFDLEAGFDLVNQQMEGILKARFERLKYPFLLAVNKRNIIYEHQFNEKISLDFKNNSAQNIDYQLDSFLIRQKITLKLPVCLDKKSGGIVSVYYRATREHLNESQKTESSAKVFDWGHAFIGIKDLKTNKLYFLDGWPDGKWGEGGQHFVWNENVDEKRTADHHVITFSIDAKNTKSVIEQLQALKKSSLDYKLVDFNCTDATTKILEKIGFYTQKDKSNTVFPDSFANQLMKKLNEIGICYEYDGYKIR